MMNLRKLSYNKEDQLILVNFSSWLRKIYMILIEIHPRQFAQVIGWIHNVFLSYWIMCMDKVIVSFNCSDMNN